MEREGIGTLPLPKVSPIIQITQGHRAGQLPPPPTYCPSLGGTENGQKQARGSRRLNARPLPPPSESEAGSPAPQAGREKEAMRGENEHHPQPGGVATLCVGAGAPEPAESPPASQNPPRTTHLPTREDEHESRPGCRQPPGEEGPQQGLEHGAVASEHAGCGCVQRSDRVSARGARGPFW